VLLGVAFSVVAVLAGVAVAWALRLPAGLLRVGLAPSLGLAGLAIAATWDTLLGGPPIAATLMVVALGGLGLGLLARGRDQPRVAAGKPGPPTRWLWATLGLGLALPMLVGGIGFAGVLAPLSGHDGAFHVETVQGLRLGQPWHGWYPVGFHAVLAAFLGLVPWIDTAQGVTQASFGLLLLAPLAVFGLGVALWPRWPLAGASAAVILGLTFSYPYSPHTWDGWPLAFSLVLVLGVWTAAVAYLAQPSTPLALATGLLVGAIVLVHGSELITVGLGLLVLLVGSWRRACWACLGRHALLAGAVAALVCAPYLPILLGWAGGGGATATGYEEADLASSTVAALGSSGRTPAVLLDLADVNPVLRIVLVPLGTWWVVRQRAGRVALAWAALFVVLAEVLPTPTSPLLRTLYAVTFPWSQEYRLMYVAVLALTLVEGAGVVALVQLLGRPAVPRRVRRLVVVASGATLVVSAVGLMALVRVAAETTNTFGPEDMAAMDWLRQRAEPGSLVANDGSADAGIWAPFKAGLPVLKPRVQPPDPRIELILSNIGQLESVPEARAAACTLGVRYVYVGAHGTRWEVRHFPPTDVLRRSTALEEAFSYGEAVVFATRLGCAQLGG
jgi:hypothetical protein